MTSPYYGWVIATSTTPILCMARIELGFAMTHKHRAFCRHVNPSVIIRLIMEEIAICTVLSRGHRDTDGKQIENGIIFSLILQTDGRKWNKTPSDDLELYWEQVPCWGPSKQWDHFRPYRSSYCLTVKSGRGVHIGGPYQSTM